jgi:hypothetical protein
MNPGLVAVSSESVRTCIAYIEVSAGVKRQGYGVVEGYAGRWSVE